MIGREDIEHMRQGIENAYNAKQQLEKAARAEAEGYIKCVPRFDEKRLDVLVEREKPHGAFSETSALSQQLKQVIHGSKAYMHGRVSLQHKEALEMIAVKMARILNGDPYEPDHWLDIAGYANLGKEAKRENNYDNRRGSEEISLDKNR